MERLFEHWRRHINEEETEEEVVLYHVSSVPNIEVLDPEIAIKSARHYTKQEYRTWDRPRVFYFTNWGQEDVGVGKIGGINGHVYKVNIKASELYPVMRDPLQFSRRIDEYKQLREKERGLPKHYPTNAYEIVATFAERELGVKGFIYPQSAKPNHMIVALWKKVPVEKVDKSFYNQERQ